MGGDGVWGSSGGVGSGDVGEWRWGKGGNSGWGKWGDGVRGGGGWGKRWGRDGHLTLPLKVKP